MRRENLTALSYDDLLLALNEVTKPDGHHYWFFSARNLGQVIEKEKCFRLAVEGSVYKQDYGLFEASISQAVAEVHPQFTVKFDSLNLTVITAEDYVTNEGLVTALFSICLYLSVRPSIGLYICIYVCS